MDEKMFCFQCEQAANGCACVGNAGVCGKSAETADAQDALTGALIGFAELLVELGQPIQPPQALLLLEGLFTTITNVNFDPETVRQLTEKVWEAKNAAFATACPAPAPVGDYDMKQLWQEPDEDIRSLKSTVLFGLRGMAAYTYHARVLGYTDGEIDTFFCTALSTLAHEQDKEKLFQLVQETGLMAYRVMELLDKANTTTFGDPEPVEVPLTIQKGPFIVISGHDLYDMKCLLEQTAGKGISIYTHSEMLPAHAYPELKKYRQLKGNFGTAWQNQQKEFADLPAPILFTTNCLMPPKASYADRVFTTEVVGYPEMRHIGEDKDFTPVIEKALELGGYGENREFHGINGGGKVMTGFARNTVLSVADTVVDAVKSGAIRHFFLVGGCDGSRPGRNYYTEFVRQTPPDTVILTLACGKYRFNDLDLGTIGGLPRVMDIGQCNDAYSAIQIALALADAFDCGVNDLPLSMILSWYEQKAVCVLLALLALGIRGIRLGPTLPAFLSPGVAAALQQKYDLKPITTPEADLAACLGSHAAD